MKLKQIITLTILSILLTACGGSILDILDDGSEKVVEQEQNITFVQREVTLAELEGTWVTEEESVDKWLSKTSLNKSRLKSRKKEFNSAFINLSKDGSVKFKDAFYEQKEYEGGATIENRKEWNLSKNGRFLLISFVKNNRIRDFNFFHFIERNSIFYLGYKYSIGDPDINERHDYLLYKKVK